MLKPAAAVICLWYAGCFPALGADEPTSLLVGIVRDTTGRAVAASVRAEDVAGRTVATGQSADDGTFALEFSAQPQALDVRCPHCRAERVNLRGKTTVNIIVTRYAALENDVPDAQDLAALPYGRVVDALALVPFSIPSSDRSNISDRGLGGGRGLVVDNGVPIVDLADGSSALPDISDRTTANIRFTRHARAYQYGSYAAGGIVTLDRAPFDGPYMEADLGSQSSIVLAPRAGIVAPGYAASSDAGVSIRRADLDLETAFAGGELRSGLATGSSDATSGIVQGARDFDIASVEYATASRHYRTFVNLALANVHAADQTPVRIDNRASYIDLDARLEHPGPVAFAYGTSFRRETAAAAPDRAPGAEDANDAADEANVYAEASLNGSRANVTAGLGIASVFTQRTVDTIVTPLARTSFLPSLSGRVTLGGGASLALGYSQASRLPVLAQYLAPGAAFNDTVGFERSELLESDVGVDAGGRIKADAVAFRELTHAPGFRTLNGIGASIAWQLAPLLSVRAWSLSDAPSGAPGPPDFVTRGRQIVWTTYANNAGLRLDLIAHRDGTAVGGAIDIDGSVWLAVSRRGSAGIGTTRRGSIRQYYVRLRTR